MKAEYIVVPDMENLVFFQQIIRKLSGDISNPTTYNILLILEEAYSNIIKYAGLTDGDTIRISFEKTDTHFSLELIDSGVAFNPLKESLTCPDADSCGGFGIFLFKNITDKATYKREKNKNKLYLRIPLTSN